MCQRYVIKRQRSPYLSVNHGIPHCFPLRDCKPGRLFILFYHPYGHRLKINRNKIDFNLFRENILVPNFGKRVPEIIKGC